MEVHTLQVTTLSSRRVKIRYDDVTVSNRVNLVDPFPGRRDGHGNSNLPKVRNHGKSNLPKIRDHRKSMVRGDED